MTLLALSFASYLFSLLKRQLIYLGLILQSAYLISRGLELGRLPLIGPHDTIVFLTASVVMFSAPISFVLTERRNFSNAIAVFASVLTVCSLIAKPHNTPLPPVLRTLWFEAHVVLAFLSYALFAIASVLGYLFLKEKNSLHEGLQYRSVLIGYCLFTLSMIFGGIWAYLAWGTYWIWTPKELWTSILWFYYSFYLHARLRQWWTGRSLSYLNIAGFVLVMFTYLGVSLLMKSSHSF